MPNFGMQVSEETIRNRYETYAAYRRRKGMPGGLITYCIVGLITYCIV